MGILLASVVLPAALAACGGGASASKSKVASGAAMTATTVLAATSADLTPCRAAVARAGAIGMGKPFTEVLPTMVEGCPTLAAFDDTVGLIVVRPLLAVTVARLGCMVAGVPRAGMCLSALPRGSSNPRPMSASSSSDVSVITACTPMTAGVFAWLERDQAKALGMFKRAASFDGSGSGPDAPKDLRSAAAALSAIAGPTSASLPEAVDALATSCGANGFQIPAGM